MFVDKDQHTRKSELCWSLLSTLLARHRCCDIGAPKISLVNEAQCGTGTEWRDLIGQQEDLDVNNTRLQKEDIAQPIFHGG